MRLIEKGFPCHQVGAETLRERDTGKAPPVNRLHVWWARRPLTPSRAAITASLAPADTDPETFLRRLGIEKVEALVHGIPWTLTGPLLEKIETGPDGAEYLPVDDFVLKRLAEEEKVRSENRKQIADILQHNVLLENDPTLTAWQKESEPIAAGLVSLGDQMPVFRRSADPSWAKRKMGFTKALGIRFHGESHGYPRAFTIDPGRPFQGMTVLDPTSGGGSIPFEAIRLGCRAIANEINPVATTILYATLSYPIQLGLALGADIEHWGNKLLSISSGSLKPYFPEALLPETEQVLIKSLFPGNHELLEQFSRESIIDYIFVRQATCPHCKGEAPLLNTCWLSKEAGDPWGVAVVTDGKERGGKVTFQTYRVKKGKGPGGEDPDMATVVRGAGRCVHCGQGITGDEIKAQARGESSCGKWADRLYAVVAVRFEPQLDKNGQVVRYKSGSRKDEIKTKKVRFFRPPNQQDLDALQRAQERLMEKWDEWEEQGLIPTEAIPVGNDMRPIYYGMPRWCDLFTPRQLLGHLTLVEGLNQLKPRIMEALGSERGKAVVTYLQFAIDKGLDYNSRQTRWIPQRGIVSGTFGRHDFSLKWTFGEMIFTGPNSGAAWGLSQILDAYRDIAELVAPLHKEVMEGGEVPVTILHGTAAHMPQVEDCSVDLVCMDPPYYNNVQYAELSDYFYVWQKRTLKDLYPDLFYRRLTNKQEEATANPVRDGSTAGAKAQYERIMGEIFRECRRVVKDDGLMTLMFTHKTQDAWETLATSLMETGWVITASFPVESEFTASLHQKDMATAASSIFIATRKRTAVRDTPAFWTGFGGRGVQSRIVEAVKQGLADFEPLRLNPVDEMVACYGRALQVLSENWPVMDGDQPVGPMRAMLEASRVTAENQVARITAGRLSVTELDTETAMALTLMGIFGLSPFSFDEALSLSRSLNMALEGKTGGYRLEGRMVGINAGQHSGRGKGASRGTGNAAYHAPLVRSGSKLRLVRPEERHGNRIERPLTDWDVLHGIILEYRRGGSIVAHRYLEAHRRDHRSRLLDLLEVWGRETGEESLEKETVMLLFELRSQT